jgi:broad specificity phosphatase PhoE/nicotinamide riboside kinase
VSERSGQAFTGAFDAATRAILPSAAVTAVHLLRHGEVGDLAERVVRGQLDVPLSARGREQSAALARWFVASETPLGAQDVLVSSDLSRCRELAQTLGALAGREPVIDRSLREQTMGRWEGRTWADITAAEPDAVRAYWDDYHRARPTGGESLEDLQARVVRWWNGIHARHAGARIVIVTHIGVIRVLVCHLLGLELGEALRLAPAVASHTSLLVSEAGAVLETLGERPWSFVVPAIERGVAGARVVPAQQDAASPREPMSKHADPPGRIARPLRIALSGSAGTGKTTLGRRLARELGVAFLEERMRERLERGFDVHSLSPSDWRALIRSDWEAQREAEERAGSFVADRSSLDYAAFWLHYDLHGDVEATESWMQRMFEDAERYDRILLFPWGALPLADDGVRSTNRWTQLRFQCALEGVAQRFARSERMLRVPHGDDFEQRVAFVLEELDQGRAPTR